MVFFNFDIATLVIGKAPKNIKPDKNSNKIHYFDSWEIAQILILMYENSNIDTKLKQIELYQI